MNLRERIAAEDKKLTEASRYALYTLHSNMQVRIRNAHNYETVLCLWHEALRITLFAYGTHTWIVDSFFDIPDFLWVV
jgi:hypothetical protein